MASGPPTPRGRTDPHSGGEGELEAAVDPPSDDDDGEGSWRPWAVRIIASQLQVWNAGPAPPPPSPAPTVSDIPSGHLPFHIYRLQPSNNSVFIDYDRQIYKQSRGGRVHRGDGPPLEDAPRGEMNRRGTWNSTCTGPSSVCPLNVPRTSGCNRSPSSPRASQEGRPRRGAPGQGRSR